MTNTWMILQFWEDKNQNHEIGVFKEFFVLKILLNSRVTTSKWYYNYNDYKQK
jgi:hypothetical protein